MSREYTITGSNVTIAAAATLIFINPKAGPASSLEILRCSVSQSANATSAQERIQLVTQVSTFPTLTTVTPAKTKLGDPISEIVGGTSGAAGTSGIDATAEGGGAKTVILEESFNVLNGWLWVPTPRETIILRAGETSGFGVHFPAGPTTLTGWSFMLTFAEIG